jgi:hypothetical protein
MGMFDQIRSKYPLPLPEFQDMEFQTKDTPNQFMDDYEIREDGTLWACEYDIEDRSDPNAKGIARMCGSLARVNPRWVQVPDFTGEICFYNSFGPGRSGWIEFSAYFVKGKLNQLHTLVHRKTEETPPTEKTADKAPEKLGGPEGNEAAESPPPTPPQG